MARALGAYPRGGGGGGHHLYQTLDLPPCPPPLQPKPRRDGLPAHLPAAHSLQVPTLDPRLTIRIVLLQTPIWMGWTRRCTQDRRGALPASWQTRVPTACVLALHCGRLCHTVTRDHRYAEGVAPFRPHHPPESVPAGKDSGSASLKKMFSDVGALKNGANGMPSMVWHSTPASSPPPSPSPSS